MLMRILAVALVACLCQRTMAWDQASRLQALRAEVGPELSHAVGSSRQLLATGSPTKILSNGTFAPGWELKYNQTHNSVLNIQNLTMGGVNQQNALCATLTYAGSWLSLHCVSCSSNGVLPFQLNNTSGVTYDLSQTNDSKYTNDTINRFALQVILQDDSGKQLCTMYSDDTTLNKNNNNLQQILVPFQNYPSNNQNPPLDCRNALKNATMIGFQALFDGVTFCVDDVALEPSMVVTAGAANASNSLAGIPPYQNCNLRALMPVTPDGNYTNIRASLPGWMLQNIPAPAPAAGFTVIPSVDVPFRNYLKSVNGSCSIITTANMSAINNCAVTENSFGYCCYNASGYTDGQNGATLPAFLTNVCNKMILNSGSTVAVPGSPGLDWSCNGFFFDNATQIATFRSTQGGSTIDIPHSDEACNTPTGVTWVRNSVLPGYQPQPGGVDLRSIHIGSLQLGWRVNSTSNITLQEVPVGINGSSAMCAVSSVPLSSFQFTCQDCPSVNEPFAIGNTAGIQTWISAAHYGSSTFTATAGAFPLMSQLQDSQGVPLCNLTLTPTGLVSGNLYQATALYQNAQACVPVLGQAATLSLVMNSTAGGAVCVSGLTLLPSQVVAAGDPSVTAIPAFPNCASSAWTSPKMVQPQSTSQGGNFTVTGYNTDTNHSVVGGSDAQTYMLFQDVDMPNTFLVNAANFNASCSDYNTTNVTDVLVCAAKFGHCCYDSKAAHYQAGVNDSSLPEALANICNDLWLGAQVCQGFILDSDTGIASFLYQQHYAYINLTQQAAVCNRPDSSMWLLKGAIANTYGLKDDRQPPKADGKSGGNGGASAGTVLGILLGVATPASGAAAWLIVTYSYRQAKRRIVLGVGKYVKAEDLADVSDEDAASPTQDASPAQQPAGSVQMVTVSGGQALAQASSLPRALSRAVSTTPLTLNAAIDNVTAGGHPASPEMREAATQIAQHCIYLWDGILGLQAGSDSAGARAGVWRGKFDGVRCAVLLLAFRKLNKSLLGRSDAPGSLLKAWKECKSHRQKQDLVRKIAIILQGIDVTEAQNLPDKDPEIGDQQWPSWRSVSSWRRN